jgi:solute carrier family 35 protein E1
MNALAVTTPSAATLVARARRGTEKSRRRSGSAAAARSGTRERAVRASAARRGVEGRWTEGDIARVAVARRARANRARTVMRSSADKPLDHVWDKLKSKGESAVQVLMLLGLFACWYGFNIVFNIYNKQILKTFPYPVTVTLIELGVGSALICAMWASGAKKPPTLTKEMLKPIAPLAVIHAVGNLLTNVSLGKVAVSFTHTIKAMEPFFSVLLSALFLGDIPSLAVVGALVPVVGGVALASMTEVSFCWAGFLAAMGSNITFQSRNVLSKKMMGLSSIKGAIDNINLFSVITMLSCLVCLPIAVSMEGVKFTPAAISAVGVSFQDLSRRLLIAGFCFQMYQQISYMILSRVSPVTHAVGNCMKRVTVIVVTLLYFKNPVSPLNMAGTALALSGVFLYSRAKRAEGEKKKQAKEGGASSNSVSAYNSAYNNAFRATTGLSNLY